MHYYRKYTYWVIILMVGWVTPLQAGQVVTDADRVWAKQAAEERALETVAAPNTLAVLYYHNKSGNPDWDVLQKGLAIMITTDIVQSSLVQSGKVQVIERSRIQALFEEQGLGLTGLVAPDSAPEMGRMLAAAYVSGGDLNKGVINELQVNPLLVEVPNDLIMDQPQVDGDLADLIRIEKTLLFDILERMEIELTPEEREELAKPLFLNIESFNRFMEGVNFSDSGQYTRAAQSYRHALVEDPNFTLAQDALGELRELGLIVPEGVAPLAGEGAPPPPTGEGGSAFGNAAILTAGIVGGLGLLIGLPLIAANQSDDGDSSANTQDVPVIDGPADEPSVDPSEETPVEPIDNESPIVTHTTPFVGATIPCTIVPSEEDEFFRQSIQFYFSEAMNPAVGNVSVRAYFQEGGAVDVLFQKEWSQGNNVLNMVPLDDFDCDTNFGDLEELLFSLFGFQDTNSNFLTGDRTFLYYVDANP